MNDKNLLFVITALIVAALAFYTFKTDKVSTANMEKANADADIKQMLENASPSELESLLGEWVYTEPANKSCRLVCVDEVRPQQESLELQSEEAYPRTSDVD
jgi:heme/copper-type cytochrome/quinol oxidase subunit 2